MLKLRSLIGLLPFLSIVFAPAVSAEDLTAEFDAKHKSCLERIAEDNEQAFEEAMIWQDDGGGRRAKHCVAMALFALGHEDEAAHRLEALAKAPDGGTPAMRADFYAEASNFWLLAGEANNALRSTGGGLKISEAHVDLRIAHARALAMVKNYEAAEEHLSYIVAQHPINADARRYLADTHYQQDRFDEAKRVIETALDLDPASVETALLRGRINEAIRTGTKPSAP